VLFTLATRTVGAESDHLKCYKIKDPLNLGGTIDLDTLQFGAESGCSISEAKLFCAPASNTSVSVEDHRTPITPLTVFGSPTTDDRVCYKLKCPGKPSDQVVTDQFGTRTLSKFKASLVCTPAVKGAQYCGDGVRNGGEACEGHDVGGATCADAGFTSGTVACGDDCQLDTSACSGKPPAGIPPGR
jgi:hypothetical protein